MYSFAKILLKLSSALAAIIIVGTLLIYAFSSGSFGLAVPWIFLSVIVIWVPVSAICLLVLAITSPKGANASMENKVAKPIHWAISAFFILLASYLIYSQRFAITLLLQGTTVPGAGLTFLAFLSAALALIASLSVFLHRAWAKYLFLTLAAALFVRAALGTGQIYSVMNIGALIVAIGLNGFTTLLALASYFYLRRESTA